MVLKQTCLVLLLDILPYLIAGEFCRIRDLVDFHSFIIYLFVKADHTAVIRLPYSSFTLTHNKKKTLIIKDIFDLVILHVLGYI